MLGYGFRYSDFGAGASGLLSLRQWPVPGLRLPGEDAPPNAPYGDGLVQEFHLLP